MSPITEVVNSGVRYRDGNNNCGNSAVTTNYTENVTHIHKEIAAQPLDQAKSDLLHWISPAELQDNKHEAVRQRRFEGVGNWLIQTSEFKDWAHGSADPTLFCYGDPGVGKTFISSLVIDTLCPLASQKKLRVFYLYCDYLNHKGQSATDLIAGLLRKVVTGLNKTPKAVSQEFENSKKHGDHQRRPLLQDLVNMLGTVLASFDRAFICIDALDELPESQRPDLLRSLAMIVKRWPTIRLFLTGRPQIQREIELRLEGAQTMSTKSRVEDIKRYITHRLDQDLYPGEMNAGLAEEIKTTIPQKVSGIFLLAYLKMNAILDEITVSDRRAKLMAMEDSPELQSEYGKTLVRINEQSPRRSELALRGLMLLCHSKRPLHADELRHALAIEKGSASLNLGKVSSIGTLLDCCLGLVTEDREASTIHLIHSTLKDYLQDNPGYFQRTDLTIAETCLTYLNFDDIKHLSPSLHIAPAETPFLRYASRYWGEHVREETTEHAEALVKKLFDQHDKHISAKLLLLENSWPWGHPPEGCPEGFSELHCLAFFGITEIAALLMGQKAFDLDQRDITGSTPLIWAARNGHERFLELLLKKGANPATTGIDGRTPLSWAAGKGSKEVVKALLSREDAKRNFPDDVGRTPLSWAAGNGHKEVVTMFLEKRGGELGGPDKNGRTPISWASGCGHHGVVELLLDRRGNSLEGNSLETKDHSDRTPLSWASGGGHENVVRLLLEKGADPNSTDKCGRTPVSWAAEGRGGVVDFSREQGADPNFADDDGRAPLSRAAESGRRSVVGLLLAQIGIKSDMPDKSGMTPLSWAASTGNEGVVKIFLEKGEADPNSPDNHGRTPLWWAAGSGHAEVVKIMLGWGDAGNPDLAGESGQTPLIRAAMYGHERVVKVFLECKVANPNLSDNFKRTPLSWAAGSWHDKIVELLLEGGNIDTELADKDDRTPLWWAARTGNERAVELLLRLGRAKPDLPDKDGRTPLLWAARNGDESVVQLLLKEGDATPDSRDTDGRTPVSWAAAEGHEKLVDILLSRPDADPNSADNIGRTPLSWAAENGRKAVTKLLLTRGNIEPDAADGFGRTPLLWAARNGCDEVVQLLIDHPNVNPDSRDNDKRTPLSRAAEEGYEKIINRLLGRNGVNSNSADRNGQTPLLWAARNGHDEIVELLLRGAGVEPDLAANDGRTPLSWAAYGGHKRTVQLLLQQGNVNPNSKDCNGWTPLSWANENQHQGIAQLLRLRQPVSTTPPPPDPIPEPQPLTLEARDPVIGSTIPTHIFGCLPLRLSACIISYISLFFPYSIAILTFAFYSDMCTNKREW